MSLQFIAQGAYRPGSTSTPLAPRRGLYARPESDRPSHATSQTQDDEPPPPYSQHDPSGHELSHSVSTTSTNAPQNTTTRTRASSHTSATQSLPRPFTKRLALLKLKPSTPLAHEYVIAADTDPCAHDPSPHQLERLYAVTIKPASYTPEAYPHTASLYDQHPLFGRSVSPIPDLVIHSTPTAGTSLTPLVTARAKGDGDNNGSQTSNDTVLRMQPISPFPSQRLADEKGTCQEDVRENVSYSKSEYPPEKTSHHNNNDETRVGHGEGKESSWLSTPEPSSPSVLYQPSRLALPPLASSSKDARGRGNSTDDDNKSNTMLRDLPLSSSIEECLVARVDYPSVAYSFSTYVDADAPPISVAQAASPTKAGLQARSGRTRLEKFEWRVAPTLNPMAAIGLDSSAGDSGRKGKKKKQDRRLEVYLDLLLGSNELVNDEDGDGYMWQLVRCSKTEDKEIRDAGVDRDAAVYKGEMTEQGEEVVAVWTYAKSHAGGGGGGLKEKFKRLSMRGDGKKSDDAGDERALLFKFLGTGMNGMLGERWSLMAFASAIRIYQVLKT